MSRDSQDRLRQPSQGSAISAKRKRDPKQAVEELNSEFKHLSDNILNKHPYLLSVPSDVPYRHSSRFVNTWHVGTPFALEEEVLQYMSFFPHQGEEETLLHVEGGWSDEKGNILAEEKSPRIYQTSGQNTPVDGAQRKKISLTDYKGKGKTATDSVQTAEQPRDLGKQAAKINGPGLGSKQTVHENPNGKRETVTMSQSKKRPRDDTISTLSNTDGSGSPMEFPPFKEESPRPEKRPRTSSGTDVESKDGHHQRTERKSSPKPKVLPGLLSPTLPSPDKERSIPKLVSPTLPPSIAGYFARHPILPGAELALESTRSDTVRSILASASLGPDLGSKKAPGRNTLGVENRVRSASENSVRSVHSTASAAPNSKSPISKAGVRTPIKPGTPLQNGFRSSPGPRQRHTIALKYGKKNRKRVEALLKFAPRPKKLEPRPIPAIKLETDLRGEGGQRDNADRGRKPALERSPEITSKKPKPSPSTIHAGDKPSTPIPSTFHSPSIQAADPLAKAALSTPKKEFKSIAMQRVASGDILDARTPAGDRARLSTPSAPANKISPPPTSTPSHRDEDRASWHSLTAKYFALGRTIKREATSMGPFSSEEQGGKEAVSVVLLIEALLCFMINLSADSYYRSNSDPVWSSILPYHIFVFRASRRFPHLHGVVVQLGAVCRQYIHKYNMDRLARDPLPEEQVGSAPTPGSDGNTKTTEDGEKYKKKYIEFRDDLVANSRELQTAWMDGSRQLSLDTLEREYPKTWKNRARDSTLRGVSRVHPNRIPQDYFLPLDANATAFEATRFTLSFLEEWTEKEKVSWKSRIEL